MSDELDQKIDTSIAAVNLTNRAGFIVADEVNKVMEKAITAGWEGGVQEIRKAFPTIKPEKIEAMLRRQIHVELVKIHTEAASAWDDVLFMGHSPRFEPPNPDDPHGGDDPHGHQ